MTEYSSNPTYAMLCHAMLFVHRTNRNVHWTFKCLFVQWTNGHCLMANTSASYRQGVMLNHITSLYFIALLSDAVKVTCPFDIMKCPLDIQKCLFAHRTNRNVHWTFQMSITEMSSGHSNVHWTYCSGVDIQKYLFVHRTNRNVHWTFQMCIRPLDEQKCPVDIQMSIGHIAVVLDMYA